MADVALDPANSNPKELYGQGIRAYVLQDYDTAVRAFSKASELLAIEHENDIHDSLGDVYLYYGKSLLELSRRESGPLGDGVLKNIEEESETEEADEEIEGEEEKPDDKEGGDKEDSGKTDNTKGEEEKPDDKEGGDKEGSGKTDDAKEEESGKNDSDDAKVEEANPEEDAAPSEDKSEEQKEEKDGETKEAGASSDKKECEAEDDLTDLQVAWEVLELAKRIFTNRGDDGKKNLAETYIILGEISLESGNFSSAVEDILEGLKIQKSLYGNDSRAIAETYYKLGGAYSTNGQIDEAVESFNSALEYLQNKVKNLKKDEEHKEANADEIQELDNLIPEVQEKIADMKNLKVEIANKMTASVDENAPKVNGNSEASSSKQVNDISHLVKRKRKDEDGKEENPAKRPST